MSHVLMGVLYGACSHQQLNTDVLFTRKLRTASVLKPGICRIRLASVTRELRRWSAEHGDDLWHDVEFSLGGCSADSACWDRARWLQRHVVYVRKITLDIRTVRP